MLTVVINRVIDNRKDLTRRRETKKHGIVRVHTYFIEQYKQQHDDDDEATCGC